MKRTLCIWCLMLMAMVVYAEETSNGWNLEVNQTTSNDSEADFN